MKSLHSIPQAWTATSKLFIALGDEQRQRILLAFESDERLSISQIVAVSTLSRTAVTHHLKVLKEGGALVSEKVGKEVFFRIDKETMEAGLEAVLNYIKNEI